MTTENGETMAVEVIYAELQKVWHFPMQLALNATVSDALMVAKRHPDFPRIEIDPGMLAVFGQTANLQTRLHNFDRVEILRPLLIAPMDARRGRVVKKARP